MSKVHVIAMDTHSQTTDICIKTQANGPGHWHHVKTTIPEIAAVLERVRGPKALVLEEGPLAGWLLRNLKARVDRAEACNPRRNALIAKDGDKDDPIDAAKFYNIYGFATNATFPFPTETSVPWIQLPYIAFDYSGQLVSGQDPSGENIPIAKGSVLFARDTVTRAFQFNPPDVAENPPGNSTNSMYRIVHIDRLTGRATLEYQRVQ